MVIRGVSIVIGLFLLAVWIAGLVLHTQPWITWLDFVGGLAAVAIGIAPVERGGEATTTGMPLIVALGLFAMWIVGLVVHTEAWITWCTFGAACALLIDSLSGGFTVHRARLA